MFKSEILADSVNDRGHRLTSFLVTYPRIIHSEFLTHAMLVRNSESSRARPVQKNIDDVIADPFVPPVFGQNQPGMQWSAALDTQSTRNAEEYWRSAISEAIWVAKRLSKIDVHKSLANRPLEPYKWHTALYTGTDWDNFFALRTHPDAQPEFREIALMMQEDYQGSTPRLLKSGEWHVPFVSQDEIDDEAQTYPDPFVDWTMWRQVSAGRCARLSYLTHDGKRDRAADVDLAMQKLAPKGHMSPFGHQARPFTSDEWEFVEEIRGCIDDLVVIWDVGHTFKERMMRNLEYCAQFRGWWQQRADIPNEDNFQKVLEQQ